jgi:serine phosphatase RsbU (regulator of sigma subunit)
MDEERVRILLVEDDPDDVYVMQNLLGDRWYGPFELVNVELLSAAIERCQEERFDVVLLDLGLPDSNGLETFFSIYAHAGDVPIVVLSGLSDERAAVKAVQAGAQDYLVKGQLTDRLLVRSLRYAIERSRRHHAEEALLDTSEEFRAAGVIQQRLYPAHAPTLEGFEIAGALYPAKATAGDYFDYIPMLDNCLGLVVGDVSSHGMGPALVMSETRACLRTLAQGHSDVGEILTRANRVLAADSSELHFVTLAMARLDPHNRTMVYASAGQRGYLLQTGCNVTVLDSTSLPLGIREDTVVPPSQVYKLTAGDLVTFFTDGVVESESPGLVRFGFSRALEVIRSERQKSAQEIIQSLHDEIKGFCRNQPQRDDITIAIVKVL